MLAVYDCRGDLKSFNDRFEDGGSGNSQDKRRELRKKLKDDRMKAELQWERYHNALKRRGAVMDKTLEKCYEDALRTIKQATTLLEREMRAHLLAALDEIEDKPPGRAGSPTPVPKAPPDRRSGEVAMFIVNARDLLK